MFDLKYYSLCNRARLKALFKNVSTFKKNIWAVMALHAISVFEKV